MKPNQGLSRRRFISTSATVALTLATTVPGLNAATRNSPRRRRARQRVTILATEVRRHSHAQHFIDRFLEGYGWQGSHYYPPLELASIYVDQFPERDLSRDRERRHGVRIYPTIAEALTLGTSKLAVDGVLIIAEHGKYPRNKKGQTRYPRYDFFRETVKVFEASGRTAPVFNDKHLSTEWSECVDMVETAKRLKFAFMAGSSLPVTWRIPSIEMPLNTPLVESVCVCYGGVDSYDFHGLETAQCMSERRKGGESGVKKMQALRGEPVWSRLEEDRQTRELFFAALTRSISLRAPTGYTIMAPSLDWVRQRCSDPVGYFYEHNDGLRTAMFLMNGLVTDFTYAGLRRDNRHIISCQMFLPMPLSISTTADFFNPLVNNIERLVREDKTPIPVERTLLTSGMTLFGVESLFRGQARLDTPEMAVSYQPMKESTYWRT